MVWVVASYQDLLTKVIERERCIQVSEEDLLIKTKLNYCQKIVYEEILEVCMQDKGTSYSSMGQEVQEKIFVQILLATIRSSGYIAIATTTFEVETSLLQGVGIFI